MGSVIARATSPHPTQPVLPWRDGSNVTPAPTSPTYTELALDFETHVGRTLPMAAGFASNGRPSPVRVGIGASFGADTAGTTPAVGCLQQGVPGGHLFCWAGWLARLHNTDLRCRRPLQLDTIWAHTHAHTHTHTNSLSLSFSLPLVCVYLCVCVSFLPSRHTLRVSTPIPCASAFALDGPIKATP